MQEQEAIANLNRLGWGIRRIARELGLSRNTVRSYIRSLIPPAETVTIAEGILQAADPSPSDPGNETDPLSTAGSTSPPNQTDPLSTAGNTGRKSLCVDHAELILAKLEEGLTAQRIYQDLRVEISFPGSYQSVKRYVRRLRRTDPQLVHRIEVEPGEEVQVDFGTGPTLLQSDGQEEEDLDLPVGSELLAQSLQPSRLAAGHRDFSPVHRGGLPGVRRLDLNDQTGPTLRRRCSRPTGLIPNSIPS